MRSGWLIAVALAGCGGGGDEPPPGQPEIEVFTRDEIPDLDWPCPPGERLANDGACLAPGVPDDLPCPPGQWLGDDGLCFAAGVPAQACALGFELADDRCMPILPSEDCQAHQMATPGDAACRPVADCGSEPWGSIPDGPTTEHVDPSSTATPDGSRDAPWLTLADALAAAEPGDVIGLAAGSYPSVILGKSVTLWGRCPDLVTVAGGGFGIRVQADGVTLRGLRVTGSEAVQITDRSDLLLTEMELDGGATAVNGIRADVVMRDVLLEASGPALAQGGTLTIERLRARNMVPINGFAFSAGVIAQAQSDGSSLVTVRQSYISDVPGLGASSIGGELVIEGSVIRDIAVDTEGLSGVGLSVTPGEPFNLPGTEYPGRLEVRQSLVERAALAGISAKRAPVLVEDSVIRELATNVPDQPSYGLLLTDEGPEPVQAEIRHSRIEAVAGAGVAANATDLVVEAVALRGIVGPSDELGGAAVVVNGLAGIPSSTTVTGSTITDGVGLGVLIDGAEVAMRTSRVEGIARTKGLGEGVGLLSVEGEQGPPSLTVEDSVIAEAQGAGIVAGGGELTVRRCDIRGPAEPVEDTFAYGIGVEGEPGDLTAATVEQVILADLGGAAMFFNDAVTTVESCTIRRVSGREGFGRALQVGEGEAAVRSVLIEDVDEFGIAALGAQLTLSDSHILGVGPDAEGLFGDGLALMFFGGPAASELERVRVEQTARAGVANFGSEVGIFDSRFFCADLDFTGQQLVNDFDFANLGDNFCGCDDAFTVCKVRSVELTPPKAL